MKRASTLVAIGAAIAMALGATTATAAITVSPSGAISARSIGPLNINSPILTWRCVFTLDGSIDAGPITAGSQAGQIRTLTVAPNPCQGSPYATDLGTPWSLRYVRYDAGTNLYFFTVVGFSWLVSFAGQSCLYTGDVPLSYNETNGVWGILSNSFRGTNLGGAPICGFASFTGSGLQTATIGGLYPQITGS